MAALVSLVFECWDFICCKRHRENDLIEDEGGAASGISGSCKTFEEIDVAFEKMSDLLKLFQSNQHSLKKSFKYSEDAISECKAAVDVFVTKQNNNIVEYQRKFELSEVEYVQSEKDNLDLRNEMNDIEQTVEDADLIEDKGGAASGISGSCKTFEEIDVAFEKMSDLLKLFHSNRQSLKKSFKYSQDAISECKAAVNVFVTKQNNNIVEYQRKFELSEVKYVLSKMEHLDLRNKMNDIEQTVEDAEFSESLKKAHSILYPTEQSANG